MPQAHKKIKKTALGYKLLFPNDMYNNLYGSLAICGYMFSENPPDVKKMISQWRKAKANPELINWSISKRDWVERTLNFFGLEKPNVFPIAFVQSRWNCLVTPYVDGEILPLREDGVMGKTLIEGKVYPIDFNKEEEKENDKV